jgi:hypothetical protein
MNTSDSSANERPRDDIVSENRNRHERATATCLVCGGTAQKMRTEDRYLCNRCARYWDAEEVETDD